MASGKLSPRQKMINMMYLVLTALLAMNVSKEILNSFALLNSGLVKTNENFTAKNNVVYDNFKQAMLGDPSRVRPYLEKANAVKMRAQEMFNYIEGMKNELIKEVEQKEKTEVRGRNGQDSTVVIASNLLYMDGKDNNQAPTHFFFGDFDNAAPGNKAFEFKEKIRKFKQDIIGYIPGEERKNIKLGLETEDVFSSSEGMMLSWENNSFYHNPAVAVIAILTKMQNDVKNAESDIINALYNRINVDSYKFDTLAGRVHPNSNYVLIGDEYRAEIFVAGFSTTNNPQIWLGDYDKATRRFTGPVDSTSVKVQDGVGVFTTIPKSEGTVDLKGIIRVKNPANPLAEPKIFPFSTRYQSARPAIVASPTSMNVFYRGLDNPLAVSVPGIAAEDLVVSMSGAQGTIVKKSNGEYIVKPTSGANCTINVSARTKDGAIRSMGKGIDFRVKGVPNPVPEVNRKRGSAVISAAEVKYLTKVSAQLDDFLFKVPFEVKAFDVSMLVNGTTANAGAKGDSFTPEQKVILSRAHRGNVIYIDKIDVKKPDGKVERIDGNIILKVI